MDELVVSSPTQALVLADARQEQTLVVFEDGTKRKARWPGQSIPKKGKRWGLADDKPFKPLPYVDLPVGFEEKEVEQFLREQRLEDLARKIQLQILEDTDPDIRPPSPPPIYDKVGNRLNTREIRIRKAMLAEYNRLVRYMIKNIEGYVPPPEWKPQRLVKKIIVPLEKYPQAPFTGVIIGARGVNHKRLQETSGCRIFIRGKDIGDKFQTDEEMQMPMHVHIEGDTEEQIEAAEKLIEPLLNPESPEFEYARTHGMQQVALVNGFTLNKAEQRCGICGAIGHLGFDCPEAEGQSYKMANVVCSICGDKGHVAMDCKQAMEKHQRENVDWKAEAEKKQQMDSEYRSFMSDLGMDVKEPPSEPSVGVQQLPNSRPPMRPPMRPFLPRVVPPQMRHVSVGTSPAPGAAISSAGILALRCTTPGTGLPPRMQAPNGQVMRPHMRPPRPLRPGVGFVAEAWPLSNPPRVMAPRMRCPVAGRPPAPWRPPPAPWRPAPLVRGAPDVDDSLLCPQEMIERLLEGCVLAEMSRDTGTRMCVDVASSDVGGKRLLVGGNPEARERAKLHFRMWLDVNMGVNMGSIEPSSWSGTMSSPEGFPPDGFPPDGFPPTGFPPGFSPLDNFPPQDGYPPLDVPAPLSAGMPRGPVRSSPILNTAQLRERLSGATAPTQNAHTVQDMGRLPASDLPHALTSTPMSMGIAGDATPPTADAIARRMATTTQTSTGTAVGTIDLTLEDEVCAPPGMPAGFGVSWDEL